MMNFLEEVMEGRNKKKIAVASILLVAFFLFLPFNHANASILGDIAGEMESILFGAISLFLRKIVWFFVAFLVNFGAWCVDVFLDPALYKITLTGHAVDAGWRTVRDFCNMFYMFFLLLVAFSTITRSQAYSAKNVLPKILLSIFLINFSKVITELAIDCGQVFLFGIAGWMGSFSGPTGKGAGLTAMVDLMRSQFEGADNSSGATLIVLIFSIIYTFMLGSAYLILAGFLAFRLVSFVFLIIVSPFAFFGLALPSMRKYWSQWQSALISNIFAGPVLIFFIYIASIMVLDNVTYVPTVETNNLGFIKNSIYYFVQGIIPLGMMYYAVPTAKKMGALGSKYVSDYGTFAMGAYAGTKLAGKGASTAASIGHSTLKRLDKTIAGHNVGQTYSNAVKTFNSKMERIPIVGNSYIKYEVSQQQKFKEKSDKYKKLFTNMKPETMGAYIKNTLNPQEKAYMINASMEALADKSKMDNGNLMAMRYNDGHGNLDREKVQKDLKLVESYGGDPSDVYKRRMDFLDDPAKMGKEFGKAIAENRFDKIPADVLLNSIATDWIDKNVPKETVDRWLARKPKTEINPFLDQLEKQAVASTTTGGLTHNKMIEDYQKLHFLLASAPEKLDKMSEVTGVAGGKLVFSTSPSDLKMDIIKESMPKLSRGDKASFNLTDYEKIGHLFTLQDYKSVARYGDKDRREKVLQANKNKRVEYDRDRTDPTLTTAQQQDADKKYKEIDKKITDMEKVS